MFDLEKITIAINSGTIGMPKGLTYEERHAYISGKLKELGIELKPLGRKYDPEATIRVMQDYLAKIDSIPHQLADESVWDKRRARMATLAPTFEENGKAIRDQLDAE